MILIPPWPALLIPPLDPTPSPSPSSTLSAGCSVTCSDSRHSLTQLQVTQALHAAALASWFPLCCVQTLLSHPWGVLTSPVGCTLADCTAL